MTTSERSLYVSTVDYEGLVASASLCDTTKKNVPASVTLYVSGLHTTDASFSHYTPESARELAAQLLQAAEEAEAANVAAASVRFRLKTSGGRYIPMRRNEDGSYTGQVEAGEQVRGIAFSTAGSITIDLAAGR